MENLIKIADAAGKTIERIARCGSDQYLAIVFTDGTFSFLSATNNWDCYEIEDSSPSDYDLTEIGLLDRAEYQRRQDALAAKRRAAFETAERQQYEALKAKFEPTP